MYRYKKIASHKRIGGQEAAYLYNRAGFLVLYPLKLGELAHITRVVCARSVQCRGGSGCPAPLVSSGKARRKTLYPRNTRALTVFRSPSRDCQRRRRRP